MMFVKHSDLFSWIRRCLWLIIGILVGFSAVVLWFNWSRTEITHEQNYDSWLITSYVFSIIGSMGTVAAVIVALFKEEFFKRIYAPKVKVSLIDNGFVECLKDARQDTPVSEKYECVVNIINEGRQAAFDCKSLVSDIRYSLAANGNMSTINSLSRKNLAWTSDNVILPVGVPNRLVLFTINNPGLFGTPSESSQQKPKILFNGCELSDHYLEKGCWELDYFITYQNGGVKKFRLTIEWNGDFKSRKTEMKEVLLVNMEEL